jgi:diguanylate cyclase (GGDEF)-like protein
MSFEPIVDASALSSTGLMPPAVKGGASAAVAVSELALPRVSVLLVDDRPENLLALEVSLEPLGQRLVRARSGDEALRAVLDEQFAVILMDIRMPGLDGFETMALLKQRERSRNVPIIFLSAMPEQLDGMRSYSSGAVDYLLKPIEPEALRSKVSVFVTLRQNELALQAAHAELEKHVIERTKQLAETNRALEREIQERKAAERLLQIQAYRDGLTGLANRALLMEHLEQTLARSRRQTGTTFAVLMLDVDRFKIVNDSLGHVVGDRLLVAISERLTHCLREVDTAARLGGDEFAVLLDGIGDLRDATRTAERIQRALTEPFLLDGKEIMATASIGIAMMDARYSKAEELLRDADAAMYRAKDSGRARCQVFDREMHTTVMAQLRLESDLCKAVERNELVLHYQPIVAVKDGALIGFEALVRWNHPERGLVQPGEFISIAEETGLIRPLGRWVMTEACRQLAEWTALRPDLSMSVNLSPLELSQRDLVDEISRTIAQAQIDPKQLKLEITETAIMQRVGVVQPMLTRLRERGVSISLDDFGTGYSCLSYLHEFPVTTLKVDRSFVQRIGTENERPAILRAIVALARNLGIEVIAEGVETEGQLAQLRHLECDHAQGFYFSHPLDAVAAHGLLSRMT